MPNRRDDSQSGGLVLSPSASVLPTRPRAAVCFAIARASFAGRRGCSARVRSVIDPAASRPSTAPFRIPLATPHVAPLHRPDIPLRPVRRRGLSQQSPLIAPSGPAEAGHDATKCAVHRRGASSSIALGRNIRCPGPRSQTQGSAVLQRQKTPLPARFDTRRTQVPHREDNQLLRSRRLSINRCCFLRRPALRSESDRPSRCPDFR